MECLRFFVSGQTWAFGLLASEAAAHNLKGERAPMALCREPTEAAAETVDSNPAPRKKSRCAYAVRLQARSRHSGLLSLLPLLPPFSRR